MWKWMSGGLLAFLLLSNGWWMYSAVDQGVTQKYQDIERNERIGAISKLVALSTELVRGMSKQDLTVLLSKLPSKTPPFEKEGAIHAIPLSFPLDGEEKIIGVKAPSHLID